MFGSMTLFNTSWFTGLQLGKDVCRVNSFVILAQGLAFLRFKSKFSHKIKRREIIILHHEIKFLK